MKISKQIAAMVLALTATTAHAWDGSNRHYGAANSNMQGGFGFNMSFNGGQHFNANRAPRPIILRGVNFEFDSDVLTPASERSLDPVAAALRDYRGMKLEVGGHASAEGNTAYNLDLSTRRALAVRRYLVANGVRPASLSSTGYGELLPLTHNMNEQGRSLNRRVELAPAPVAF